MSATSVDIPTKDGVADARYFKLAGAGPFPGAILFMDAFGAREAIWGMAERLSRQGYFVLVPNILYRGGRGVTFDPKTAFAEADTRAQLKGIIDALSTREALSADVAAYLAFLEARPDVTAAPKGATGYCMGGACAFAASALFPERIGAVASIHAGRLVSDGPQSPHLLAGRIKAQLYFAHADQDDSMPPASIKTLEGALSEAGVRYSSELYEGAQHGFAVPDSPVYNPIAAERHWGKLTGLFAQALARS